MGIIFPSKKSKHDEDEPISLNELKQYHRYGADLIADGYVSPIVTPYDRLKELKGNDTVGDMASYCHIPAKELDALLENNYLEPTVRQLLSISVAYHVSVFWLLGYHTRKQSTTFIADKIILNAITQRNAAEQTLYKIKKKGFIGDFFRSTVEKRVRKFEVRVASTAARLVAMEHLPLAEEELYLLRGQPVFIEYTNRTPEWGIVGKDRITTATQSLFIDDSGDLFQAYQTPNFALTDLVDLS